MIRRNTALSYDVHALQDCERFISRPPESRNEIREATCEGALSKVGGDSRRHSRSVRLVEPLVIGYIASVAGGQPFCAFYQLSTTDGYGADRV
jgi:hypothetical protein